MTGEHPSDLRFVALMSIAGFASGVLRAALGAPGLGQFTFFLLGSPFGVIMAGSLAMSGIADKFWRAICFVALTTVAFYASLMFTAEIELHLPWKDWGMGSASSVSPVSLFAGGMAGGFLVIGGGLFLANLKTGFGSLTRRALRWSVLGGMLAPMGWALGPFAGPGHPGPDAPIAPFGFTPSNQYALDVVWQTGMAFALGIILRRCRATAPSEELRLT